MFNSGSDLAADETVESMVGIVVLLLVLSITVCCRFCWYCATAIQFALLALSLHGVTAVVVGKIGDLGDCWWFCNCVCNWCWRFGCCTKVAPLLQYCTLLSGARIIFSFFCFFYLILPFYVNLLLIFFFYLLLHIYFWYTSLVNGYEQRDIVRSLFSLGALKFFFFILSSLINHYFVENNY